MVKWDFRGLWGEMNDDNLQKWVLAFGGEPWERWKEKKSLVVAEAINGLFNGSFHSLV